MKPTHFKVTYTRTDEDGRDYIRAFPADMFRKMYPLSFEFFGIRAKTGDIELVKLGPETWYVEAINGKK